jgi:hypothetical protein
MKRWRRRKPPKGMEVKRIPALVQPPRRAQYEVSFLSLDDRLRIRFVTWHNLRIESAFVIMGEVGRRDAIRGWVAKKLTTEGLRRRYRADRLRRQVPEGAVDYAFVR